MAPKSVMGERTRAQKAPKTPRVTTAESPHTGWKRTGPQKVSIHVYNRDLREGEEAGFERGVGFARLEYERKIQAERDAAVIEYMQASRASTLEEAEDAYRQIARATCMARVLAGYSGAGKSCRWMASEAAEGIADYLDHGLEALRQYLDAQAEAAEKATAKATTEGQNQ